MPKYRTLIAIDNGDENIPPGAVIEVPDRFAQQLLDERAIELVPEAEAEAKTKTKKNEQT